MMINLENLGILVIGMVSNVKSAGSMAIANTKQNTRTTIVATLLKRDLPDI